MTAQWQRIELTLHADGTPRDPYRDVDVDVHFSGPDGVSVTRPAFWTGGNEWKVRFAPTSVGLWTWESVCHTFEDAGLHGRRGRLICSPPQGKNPNYLHGFLRVSADGRTMEYADGTEFFWLGDTHWLMPDRERVDYCNHPEHAGRDCPFGGQFQHLATIRQSQGFTVYQTYPTSRTSVDPVWFRATMDVQMDFLADSGFVIAFGVGHFQASAFQSVDELCRWARYLVARYGAHPVVWLTCQEMNWEEHQGENNVEVWKHVAREISRSDAYRHPHSGHQAVTDINERPLGGESWHTWFALQGGHRASGQTPRSRYQNYYESFPRKPMLETEAMYEQIDCGGVSTITDVRVAAWRALLSGCSGYTYGAGGVWALKWDVKDTDLARFNHPIEAWYVGMDLPGARQMGLLKRFFVEHNWRDLVPRFNVGEWSQWQSPEYCALATTANQLYVAFLFGTSSEGELRKLDSSAKYSAKWFSAETGAQIVISLGLSAPDGRWTVPCKPWDDAVLVVERL